MIIKRFEKDIGLSLRRLCGDINNKKILVALSGGADSVCLLTALCAVASELGFSINAIHINHMIRGEEAERDEQFCVNLCKTMGINLAVMREDIPKAARVKNQSIELCAREYRYKAFLNYSENNNIDFVATAHNANDNAETVLHNILRGSGLDGVCGIPKKRDNIIRPMLSKTREEILQYLSECKVGYVTDSTNLQNDYTRNYIRNVLLPAAKKVNHDAIGALNKLSVAANADAQYLNSVVDNLLKSEKRPNLSILPKAIQIRAVRALCFKYCSFAPESKHILAICNGISAAGEKKYYIPNGYIAITCNGMLDFEKSDYSYGTIEQTVLHEGKNFFLNKTVCVEFSHGRFTNSLEYRDKLFSSVSLDSDKIVGNLVVRKRSTGDCFVSRKVNRNVKKCFINNKIPAAIRDRIPVICDDLGIVYVPFIGAADRVYKKNSENTCNLTVCIERVGQK